MNETMDPLLAALTTYKIIKTSFVAFIPVPVINGWRNHFQSGVAHVQNFWRIFCSRWARF